MKRLIPFILVCVLLLNILPILSIAEETTATAGLTFDDTGKYTVDDPLATVPLTFEAEIYFPEGFVGSDSKGRGGTIFGNYTSAEISSVNFDVQADGKVRYFLIDENLERKELLFDVGVFNGAWTKVTLTHDTKTKLVSCYVNGELVASKSLSTAACSRLDSFVVGGDNREDNTQYFKGAMRSVAVYSDVLSADEVKVDITERDTDNLLLRYDFSDNTAAYMHALEDLSPQKNNATFSWYVSETVETDYAYSFVVVGDTQIVTEYYPDKLACIYDWILANKEKKNIQFVFGLGDITNSSTEAEWTVAKEQIAKLDGVVPYSLVRGNHDKTAGYNEAFVGGAYDALVQTNGGKMLEDSLENTYQLLTVGETDYLILCLDFGPTDEELAWASDLCEQYSDHQVIVVTHSYLYKDGTTHDANDTYPATYWSSKSNNGDDMWEEFVKKHESIVLVLSGHTASDYVVTTKTNGEKGNTVTQMLMDPQEMDNRLGAIGMISVLYFSKDGKRVEVETFSTVRNEFYLKDNQYTMTWNEVVGDVDFDYTVDIKDVVLALTAGVNGDELNKADMNGDVKITLVDVLRIIRLAVQ